MAHPIVIVDYDPAWSGQFEILRRRIAKTLGDLVARIEHVGSTAVPGLAAKPIIDLDVLLASPDDMPAAVDRLASIGYVHQGDLGVPGREAFKSNRALLSRDRIISMCLQTLPASLTAISPFATTCARIPRALKPMKS